MKPVTDRLIERGISRVLHLGVVLSGTMMVAGFVVYSIRNFTGQATDLLSHERYRAVLFSTDIPGILAHPLTYLYAGIWLLSFTPIARVILTIILFAMEKDRYYVGISSLVLLIIAVSITFAFLQ